MPRTDIAGTHTRAGHGRARRRLGLFGAALLGAAAFAAPAQAAPGIGIHGPLDGDGFPTWYQDATGLQLTRCPDPTFCGPIAPDESFYWSGSADVAGATLISAQEATVDGGNNLFGRLRIRNRDLAAGTYRFTTPFGQYDFETDGKTDQGTDVGCGPVVAGDLCQETPTDTFAAPAGSEIGPNFLQTDTLFATPPGGFIGDNATPVRVVGSTFFAPGETTPANYFQVDRIDAIGGNVVETLGRTDEFIILGQLQGAGVGYLAADSGDAGSQLLGTTSAQHTVNVHNGGSARINADSVAVTGADAGAFTVTGGTCEGAALDPGDACTVTYTFGPAGAPGARNAQLDITDDAAVVHTPAKLAGQATQPAIAVAPGSIAFGSQTVGNTVGPRTVTVSNPGSAPLHVGSASLGGANPGDYTIGLDTCSGQAVNPGSSCSVEVFFVPTAVGSRPAALNVPSDAGSRSVAINGAGVSAGNTGGGGGAVTIIGGPIGAPAGTSPTNTGASLSRLRLTRLGGATKVKRRTATRRGIRLTMGLQSGTRVVRIRIYRTTRRGRTLLSNGFRIAGPGSTLRVTQNNLALRRSFRRLGRYEVEATPGRSRTDLGTTSKLAFRIVR